MSEDKCAGDACSGCVECSDDVIELKSQSKIEEVKKWVRELIFPGKIEDFIEERKEYNSKEGEHYYEFNFYTENHLYRIVAIDRKGENNDYLGCGVLARKRRAGETWDRGNDLPDGDLTKESWNTIVRAIVCYELVKLSKFKKPDAIPEDVA